MKYTFDAVIEVDTSSSKITIAQSGRLDGVDKRVVLFPAKKRTADWADITINDRPMKPINTAKSLCRAIAQAFLPKPSTYDKPVRTI